jgi:progesterone-induced-blocking factor 1
VLQLNNDNKLAELKGELKLKAFELERLGLLNDENLNNYRRACLENEKLNKKIEVIQNEYFGLKIQSEKISAEFENKLNEKANRLETYEKLEREMDEVILQAAECE